MQLHDLSDKLGQEVQRGKAKNGVRGHTENVKLPQRAPKTRSTRTAALTASQKILSQSAESPEGKATGHADEAYKPDIDGACKLLLLERAPCITSS